MNLVLFPPPILPPLRGGRNKVGGAKNVQTLVIPLLLFSLFFTGCNQKEVVHTEAKPPVEIKVAFWGSPEEIEIVTHSMTSWQQAHPNIRVRFEHTPYTGYDSKILTRIAG